MYGKCSWPSGRIKRRWGMVVGVRKRIEMEKREVGAKMEAMMVRVINLLGEKWRVIKYMRTWRKKWVKER